MCRVKRRVAAALRRAPDRTPNRSGLPGGAARGRRIPDLQRRMLPDAWRLLFSDHRRATVFPAGQPVEGKGYIPDAALIAAFVQHADFAVCLYDQIAVSRWAG